MRRSSGWLGVGIGLVVAVTAVGGPVGHAWALGAGPFVTFSAFGQDAGGQSRVKVYRATANEVADFLPFGAGFGGGARVAVGDVNGDGIDDVVVGAGPGGAPHVQVFRGFCTGAFTPPFSCAGVFTIDTSAPIASFFAFDASFTGGVYVAVGNFDPSNDPAPLVTMSGTFACKRMEIVVATDAGGGPHVKIFRNATTGGTCPQGSPVSIDPAAPIVSFFAYHPAFAGGVRVAAGDLNNDGFADLITGSGPGGGPHVKVFRNLSTGATFGGLDTATPVAEFFAFAPAFTGGIYVGTMGLVSRRDLVIGAGAGGAPHVLVIDNNGAGTSYGFNLTTPLGSFFALDAAFAGGVRVSSISAGSSILMLGPGPGGPGIVKAMIPAGTGGTFVDTMFGAVPFNLSPLGLFPAQ